MLGSHLYCFEVDGLFVCACTVVRNSSTVRSRCDETPHRPHRPHRQQFLPHRHQITAPAPKTTISSMAAAADDWTLS